MALRVLQYEMNLLNFPFSLMIWPALSKIANLFVMLKTFGEYSGLKILGVNVFKCILCTQWFKGATNKFRLLIASMKSR